MRAINKFPARPQKNIFTFAYHRHREMHTFMRRQTRDFRTLLIAKETLMHLQKNKWVFSGDCVQCSWCRTSVVFANTINWLLEKVSHWVSLFDGSKSNLYSNFVGSFRDANEWQVVWNCNSVRFIALGYSKLKCVQKPQSSGQMWNTHGVRWRWASIQLSL